MEDLIKELEEILKEDNNIVDLFCCYLALIKNKNKSKDDEIIKRYEKLLNLMEGTLSRTIFKKAIPLLMENINFYSQVNKKMKVSDFNLLENFRVSLRDGKDIYELLSCYLALKIRFDAIKKSTTRDFLECYEMVLIIMGLILGNETLDKITDILMKNIREYYFFSAGV